jgi:hypothetical protein
MKAEDSREKKCDVSGERRSELSRPAVAPRA